jgi:hypothetical protein
MRISYCLRVAYIAVAWAKLESKQMRIYPLGLLTRVDPTTTRHLSCLHYGYRRVSARARGRKVRNHPTRHGNPPLGTIGSLTLVFGGLMSAALLFGFLLLRICGATMPAIVAAPRENLTGRASVGSTVLNTSRRAGGAFGGSGTRDTHRRGVAKRGVGSCCRRSFRGLSCWADALGY